MKKILAALLALSALTAHADDDWTHEDTVRESVYLALHAIDWAQSRDIARNPDRYAENGPVARRMIGAHPSVRQLDAYMVSSALLQYAISVSLPAKYREAFQYVTILDKTDAVVGNFSIGLRLKF